jgi:uncharacterized hydrophobic protein (TIGR00271 family)
MPSITDADLARMRDHLFFEGPDVGRKLSGFWVLLILAGIIASAGIVGDSTATVIGAMIVAPLMTPILGVVLAIVSADSRNLARSLGLVLIGAATVIAIGFLFGQLSAIDVVAETNSQVAGRVHPRLIDLVAALATGVVGAFALSRSDVSDTLPGVAIAISLVPPLAVVGLTLEAGETDESRGAMLLFLTNVGAIMLSGLIVMALFRVWERAGGGDFARSAWGFRAAQIAVVVFVAALAFPLAAATFSATDERLQAGAVGAVARDWAAAADWRVTEVNVESAGFVVRAAGPLPGPAPEDLRAALDARGLDDVDVRLTMVPETRVDLHGN